MHQSTMMPLAGMAMLSLMTCSTPGLSPPDPYGPLPSERQLAWHPHEFYGFLHFTVNTFTGKEWGYGDEPPSLFDPTDFSAEQIVSTAKMAGMKGLLLTCKHHDGFCLWPSQYTEHSVKNSPFRNGKGDVVREISEACRRHDLSFGAYLSPWDRNHPAYGRPDYIRYYQDQLRELLTRYGPVFEVWWDGANGVDLREYLPLGQRVDSWALDRWDQGAWTEFASSRGIGNRRLWRGAYQMTEGGAHPTGRPGVSRLERDRAVCRTGAGFPPGDLRDRWADG